jgi:hypothetical protein
VTPLYKAWEKLEEAEQSMQELAAATYLAEAERRWKAVLLALNAVWNKTDQVVGKFPALNGWWGLQRKARREDPLLAYLTAARHAEEHRLEDTVVRQDGTISFSVPPGGHPVHLRDIRIDQQGRLFLNSTGPVEVSATPGRLLVQPVVSRSGAKVQPPTRHLGTQLPGAAPELLGALGCAWYRRTLEEAERRIASARERETRGQRR